MRQYFKAQHLTKTQNARPLQNALQLGRVRAGLWTFSTCLSRKVTRTYGDRFSTDWYMALSGSNGRFCFTNFQGRLGSLSAFSDEMFLKDTDMMLGFLEMMGRE